MALEGIYYRNVKSISSSSASRSATTTSSLKTLSPELPPLTSSNAPLWTAVPSLPTTPPDLPPISPSTDLPPLLGGLLSGLGGLLGSPETSTASADSAGLFVRRPHKRSAVDIGTAHRRRQQPFKPHSSGPVELIAPRSFRIPKGENVQSYRQSSKRSDDVAAPVPFGQIAVAPPSELRSLVPFRTSSTELLPVASSGPPVPTPALLTAGPEPAFGFTGIFFSTFFGGHDSSWATPKDQFIWFKDFGLTING